MFDEVDRPPKNRRHITDTDMDWDKGLEEALLTTVITGRAISVPLAKFHTSPAKGRLWKKGYKVHHRVIGDNAAAWIESEEEKGKDEAKPEKAAAGPRLREPKALRGLQQEAKEKKVRPAVQPRLF